MGKKVQLTAKLKATSLLLRMMKNSGEISESSKHKLVATRTLLGKQVHFYSDGYREVIGTKLDEQEIHDSELLRFAHASILTGLPQGDKKILYVDATKNPVEVWIRGLIAQQHIAETKTKLNTSN